jgi:cytochrome b6-f complex iron-sulfur subunit
MADKKKMSVEEVLAACRRMDGAGGGGKAEPAASEPAPDVAAASDVEAPATPVTSEPASPPKSQPAAAKKPAQMSTADILAAARAGKASGTPAPKAEATAGDTPAKAPAGPKKAGPLSTADILAAARAGKSAAPKAAEATPDAAEPKPAAAAKPAAAKPAAAAAKSPAKPAAEKSAVARDTASILAAARGAAKPGPISKAEAAARVKEAPAPKTKKQVPPMPEKPAYAIPSPPAPVADEERRGFLLGMLAAFSGSALAIGFSSLAVTFNLWTLGFARFMFPNILTEPPTKFKVGFPDELAPGQVQTKYVAQFGVWIVRYEYDGAPQIYAIQTVCTHLGCTPNWLEGEQKFKCPCHGSGFYKDGINFEGPAPRPLERFAIRLADDGQLEVDKSRKFKEELGQWRDASSFVPV